MILDRINEVNDIKNIGEDELDALAKEIRAFIIEKVSRTGGHLASNLGVVELTMAIHLAYTFPADKIIWDVGHQSYTHKILTGRKDGFDSLRSYGGMSGFPKRRESPLDVFDTGHSSTSVSAGIGFVKAGEITGENYRVAAVIGDGSFTGGMTYEALNNAAHLNSNFVIILNDNNMSISENVGGISNYFNSIRTSYLYNDLKKGAENSLKKIPGVGENIISGLRKTKNSIKQLFLPGMFFEDMGITYLGPVDGHDIKKLTRTLKEAQKVKHAVIVHVMTKKGKGYEPAEKDPAAFHAVEPFDIQTGKPLTVKTKDTYTDVFGKIICRIARDEPRLVAVTAAMKDGTGLSYFQKKFPERFFDVGIAEGHAVTFAAGLAASGLKPVVAVYSSFLQRAYDQILHDVCMQNLPVIFAVDRAGLVGNDGETHQGAFDIAYLSHIPNMTVLSPKNKWELADMVRFAVNLNSPVAIRYPKGEAFDGMKEFRTPIVFKKSEVIYEEGDIAIFSFGHMMCEAAKAREILKEAGFRVSLINARFAKPIDTETIDKILLCHRLVVTVEEGIKSGGFGEKVLSYAAVKKPDVVTVVCAIDDEYVTHGDIKTLRHALGLDAAGIAKKAKEAYESLRK